VTKSLF